MVEPAGDQSQLGGRLTPRQERGEQKHGTQAKRDSSAARDLARARRLTRCVSRRAPGSFCAPRPGCKKCRQNPIFTLTSFTPLFPHSPHSAPRGCVEGARLGSWDGSGAALGGPPAAPRPGCKEYSPGYHPSSALGFTNH